jgi:hypothetical protein
VLAAETLDSLGQYLRATAISAMNLHRGIARSNSIREMGGSLIAKRETV